MREAVGGSLLFYFVLIFIFIYIVFIGLIMNYATTYRASNYIITKLEESQGGVATEVTSKGDFCENLRKRNYYKEVLISCREDSHKDAIYRVRTFVSFELPLIGVDLDLEINNETKALYGARCTIDTSSELEACR